VPNTKKNSKKKNKNQQQQQPRLNGTVSEIFTVRFNP
jgi:hypothetical protein